MCFGVAYYFIRQSSIIPSTPSIETKPPRPPAKQSTTGSPLANGTWREGIKIRDDDGHSRRSLRSSMKTPDFSNSMDMGYMEGRPLEPPSEPVKKVVPRPVPKPRRSIQQRRSSYLRSRSVELEPSDGHNFSVYQRIDRPNMPVSTVSKSEEQQSPVTARNSRRKSRAEDLLPTRRSSSSAPTPSPRKNITPKFTPKAVEIEPGSRRMSRASSRSSSMCRIKTEPLLYNSQGHPNIQPRPKQPQPVYQGYSNQDVARAEENLLNRSQSNSRKQRFSR